MERVTGAVNALNPDNVQTVQAFHQMHAMVTKQEIEDWLIEYIAGHAEVEVEEVDPECGFDELGLDSALAVGLTGDLEEWLGSRIDPTIFYNYTTISSLSTHLAQSLRNQGEG